jgi:hypothetical protein
LAGAGFSSRREEECLAVKNPANRRSAPGRARRDNQRPGRFKAGHEKLGGRKRGTPNAFSYDYKMTILEAAYRIGCDGNGKDGFGGYLSWLSERHPLVYLKLMANVTLLEIGDETTTSQQPDRPSVGSDELVRDYIRRKSKPPNGGQTARALPRSPDDWTGQDFPLYGLMQLAVKNPEPYCRLCVAAFLPPRKRRPWPQAGAA